MRQPLIRKIIPPILSAIVIIVLIVIITKNGEKFRQLFSFSIDSIFLIYLFNALTIIGNGLINRELYLELGAELSLNESIGLSSINTLANLLPFAGGMIAKGLYLNKKYKLPYLQYLSATIALFILFTSISGVIGIAGLIYLHIILQKKIPIHLAIGFFGMFLLLLILFLPIKFKRLPQKWRLKLDGVISVWMVINKNRTLILKISIIHILLSLILAGRYLVAFGMLSQDIYFADCLLFSSGTVLTQIISIAPGGLGVREGVVAGMSTLLNFDPSVSVVAVGLERLISTTLIVVVGGVYTFIMGNEFLIGDDIYKD